MIWLIGAGPMSAAYAKVLVDQNKEFKVICRSEDSARKFEDSNAIPALAGGIEGVIERGESIPESAIVAVSIDQLYKVARLLLKVGVKRLLLEKPGALEISEFESLSSLCEETQAEIKIAYNRRYYASVSHLENEIAINKLLSFHFEFTEWSHAIEKLDLPESVMSRWIMASSSHVIDLAFFLGGSPTSDKKYLSSTYIPWHKANGVYYGSGVSSSEVLFGYKANWMSAGRWSLEFFMEHGSFLLEPMEKLQFRQKGTLQYVDLEIDYSLDQKYKPGLYNMIDAFFDKRDHLPNIDEQLAFAKECFEIADYK